MKIQMKILNKEFYSGYKGKDSDGEWDVPTSEILPSYATPGSAAIDLVCTEDITVMPGETHMISTGLAIWIGSYDDKLLGNYRQHWTYAGLILPRSGLGTKGLILANTVGVIDEDYQGELKVSAYNRIPLVNQSCWGTTGNTGISLRAGDRFAQLLFIPITKVSFDIVEEFSYNTERGEGGFASTGD